MQTIYALGVVLHLLCTFQGGQTHSMHARQLLPCPVAVTARRSE